MGSMLTKIQTFSFPVVVASILTVAGIIMGNYSLAVLSTILTVILAAIPERTLFGREGIESVKR